MPGAILSSYIILVILLHAYSIEGEYDAYCHLTHYTNALDRRHDWLDVPLLINATKHKS